MMANDVQNLTAICTITVKEKFSTNFQKNGQIEQLRNFDHHSLKIKKSSFWERGSKFLLGAGVEGGDL